MLTINKCSKNKLQESRKCEFLKCLNQIPETNNNENISTAVSVAFVGSFNTKHYICALM